MPKISIIVPIYKAEAYLHKCIDSILSQTFTDYEIILIDDGSPDNSGQICDNYANKDSRIKVIHKKNGGVSKARQSGLDNARGEYLIHVDPDDWIETTMLEELYSKAIETDADMVFCDYYENQGETQKYVTQKPTKETPECVLEGLLMQQLHGSCCNKLIKRVCFNKYNICFPNNFNLGEDLYVNAILCSKIQNIKYLPKAFYHYDQTVNVNSYTTSNSREKLMDRYYMICALDKDLAHKNEISSALSVLKMEVCSTLLRRKLPQVDRSQIYQSCKDLNTIIWCKLKTHIAIKTLLWCDYKGYDKIVRIILFAIKITKRYAAKFNLKSILLIGMI